LEAVCLDTDVVEGGHAAPHVFVAKSTGTGVYDAEVSVVAVPNTRTHVHTRVVVVVRVQDVVGGDGCSFVVRRKVVVCRIHLSDLAAASRRDSTSIKACGLNSKPASVENELVADALLEGLVGVLSDGNFIPRASILMEVGGLP